MSDFSYRWLSTARNSLSSCIATGSLRHC